MKKSILLLTVSLYSLSLQAATRLVPSQYSSITSALYSCSQGDTVMVAPGTYYENINWPSKKGIKLLSSGGSSVTVIDGSSSGKVISMSMLTDNIVTHSTLIKGFTLQNGRVVLNSTQTSGGGAGLYLYQADPTISNCVFTQNKIEGDGTYDQNGAYGAAVYGTLSDANFMQCSFTNNSTSTIWWAIGGVTSLFNSVNSFTRCDFRNNDIAADHIITGAILYSDVANVTYDRVKIMNNQATVLLTGNVIQGGLIGCGEMSITNSLIVNNTINRPSGLQSEGLVIYANDNYNFSMINTTIANNKLNSTDAQVKAMSVYAYQASVTITNCILFNPGNGTGELYSNTNPVFDVSFSDVFGGFTGVGNINASPAFFSMQNFHLQNTSPCLNAGTNAAAPPIDIEGHARPLPANTNVDMGCYEMNQPLKTDGDYADFDEVFSIYPNPFSSVATILFSAGEDESVSLDMVDITGRKVTTFFTGNITEAITEIEIKRGSIPAGYYIIQLIKGNKLLTLNVVIE